MQQAAAALRLPVLLQLAHATCMLAADLQQRQQLLKQHLLPSDCRLL